MLELNGFVFGLSVFKGPLGRQFLGGMGLGWAVGGGKDRGPGRACQNGRGVGSHVGEQKVSVHFFFETTKRPHSATPPQKAQPHPRQPTDPTYHRSAQRTTRGTGRENPQRPTWGPPTHTQQPTCHPTTSAPGNHPGGPPRVRPKKPPNTFFSANDKKNCAKLLNVRLPIRSYIFTRIPWGAPPEGSPTG